MLFDYLSLFQDDKNVSSQKNNSMNFLLIIIGLVLLVLGGNWLLKSAVALSLKLNISKVVVGLTVVSFATSAPELIVSINAALNDSSDLALGNVIGSNIANLGLVLGITLLLTTIKVEQNFYKLDWPVMIIASALLFIFLANDTIILRYEGIILCSFLVVFLIYLLRSQKNIDLEELDNDTSMTSFKTILFLINNVNQIINIFANYFILKIKYENPPKMTS